MNKSRKIWERDVAAGEGALAHDLFIKYIDLGTSRSHTKLAELTERSVQLIATLSGKFSWRKRTKAFTEHMQQVRQRALERAEEEQGIKQALRRAAHREDEYQLGVRLMNRVLVMLEQPIFEDVVSQIENVNGVEVATQIIRKPVRWSHRDIPAFIETLSKLMRLCLELETSRGTLNVNVETPEHRRRMASAALSKLRQDVELLVDKMLIADSSLSREEAKVLVLEELPSWVAADWNVPIEEIVDDLDEMSASSHVLPLLEDENMVC